MRYVVIVVLCAMTAHAQSNYWFRFDKVSSNGYKELFVLDDSAAYLASSHGLYRSTNGGNFWRQVISPAFPGDIFSIAPNPRSSPQGLILSTFLYIDNKGTAGIFNSLDGGVTWGYLGGAVGNSGKNALPAGMEGYYMQCNPDNMVHLDLFGFLRRYIDGLPWDDRANIRGFATFDDNRAILYTHSGMVYVSGSGSTPWRQGWRLAITGIEHEEILHIFTEGDDAWAGTALSGIRHSTRPDFRWSDASGGLGGQGDPSMRVRRIFRDKRGPLVAMTSDGFYNSADGMNWQHVSSALPGWESVGRAAIDFQGRYFVLYGRDNVIVSEDEARTWIPRMTGLEMDSVRDIILQDGELLAAGAQCVFGYASSVWMQRIEGLATTRIRLFGLLPDTSVIAIDDAGRVSRRVYRGAPWTALSDDLLGENVRCVGAGPDGFIFAGTERGAVFVSTDGGSSWAATHPGSTTVPIAVVLPVNDRLLFAGSFGEGLYQSTDHGENWIRVNNGLTHPNITSLARTPDGDLFAGTYGGGVFRSEDDGVSWTPTPTAVPGIYITALVSNHIGVVAAATYDAGVFYTRNDGATWSAMNDGLEDTRIVRLLNSSTEGLLIALTEDGAMFRKNVALPTAIHDAPVSPEFILRASYPNPFHDEIAVEYEMPRAGTIRLLLCDLLGSEVARREEEVLTNGSCHSTLSTVSLPSGVYVLSLESGGSRQQRVLTHIR